MGRWQDRLWGIARGLEAGIRLALDGWRRWRSGRGSAPQPDAALQAALLQHATSCARVLLDCRLRLARQRVWQQCQHRSQAQFGELDRLTSRAGCFHRARPPA